MVVTPTRAASRRAARAAARFRSRVGGGMARATRSIALSFSRPVGSPRSSRTMVPPGTSLVSRVTPASFKARPLASAMCPSSRFTNTGWSGVVASRSALVGSFFDGQRSWSQFPFRIQVPAGRVFAWDAMRRANSASSFASRRSTDRRPKPPSMKWTWASLKPGTTNRPCELDDPGLRTDVGADVAVAPHGQDVLASGRPGRWPGEGPSPPRPLPPRSTRSAGSAPRQADAGPRVTASRPRPAQEKRFQTARRVITPPSRSRGSCRRPGWPRPRTSAPPTGSARGSRRWRGLRSPAGYGPAGLRRTARPRRSWPRTARR